jgi:hypothetical protein
MDSAVTESFHKVYLIRFDYHFGVTLKGNFGLLTDVSFFVQ